ncbi:unnamed protein product [Strongylus vulgaris]|uniref:Uncharacterized protein n=1 Tax=Strongylus vulgaris TaxID=40348 RepID=A0A3P7JJC8_STRVU|nr:unnamed protein product [Strongylus vulgaris]
MCSQVATARKVEPRHYLIFLQALRDKADTYLIVGLSDSGKTHIFGKIANRNLEPVTYTSFQENVLDLDVKGKHLKVRHLELHIVL